MSDEQAVAIVGVAIVAANVLGIVVKVGVGLGIVWIGWTELLEWLDKDNFK